MALSDMDFDFKGIFMNMEGNTLNIWCQVG